MKTSRAFSQLSVMGALAAAAQLAACGGPLKYNVPSAAAVPGADAKIVADVSEDQHQTLVEMTVTNLAPPDRVMEGGTHYVAWYRPGAHAQWTRMGALDYDPDAREAELHGSAPETAFDFEVSAEVAENPVSPTEHLIFAQRIGK